MWVGPVTFVQTDAPRLLKWFGAPERASAYPRVIPAGEALLLEPGTILELRLRSGGVVKGRFLGRTVLDDSVYTDRFGAGSRVSSFKPFALGETLSVALQDGRVWTLPFAGYGQLALLLRSPDQDEPLRVPFEFAAEVRGASGASVEPKALASAFRAGKLPSAEAIALEALLPIGNDAVRWNAALRVPVEDIERASVEVSPGNSVAGAVALGAFVGVVLLIVLIARASHHTQPGCTGPTDLPPIMSSVRLTPRPFDLDRACYVGEALAVADPGPGPMAAGGAVAIAAPSLGDAPPGTRPVAGDAGAAR